MRHIANRGRWAFGLTVAGFAWAFALIPAAFLAPVYSGQRADASGVVSTTSTLVGENGLSVLLIVALPTVLAALAGAGLHRRCSGERRAAGSLAWIAIGMLAAFCILGAWSIGLYVLPIVLLLAGAATLTPPARA